MKVLNGLSLNGALTVANGNGTAGQVLLSGGSGAPSWATLSVATYPTTIGSIDNSTAETDLIQFTVPANTWLDRQTIEIIFSAEFSNGTTGSISFTPKFYWGVNALTMGSTGVVASGTVSGGFRCVTLTRNGSSINAGGFGSSSPYIGLIAGAGNNNYAGLQGGILTSQSFNEDTLVRITGKWASAGSSTVYYHVFNAIARKTG